MLESNKGEEQVHRVSSSLFGPVDPSLRANSGRFKFTVRRQLNKDAYPDSENAMKVLTLRARQELHGRLALSHPHKALCGGNAKRLRNLGLYGPIIIGPHIPFERAKLPLCPFKRSFIV